ncbi:hypothetical protein FRB90_010798 [Tulasnella sp. 427]|nr:hypothetical protein FRB90_010798 [Tulasnella sp. 427]
MTDKKDKKLVGASKFSLECLGGVLSCTVLKAEQVPLTVPASFTNFNPAFNPSFGNGSTAFGVLATDAISVGSLSVMNQPFEVITGSSGNFDGPNARSMGFMFESLAQIVPLLSFLAPT